MPTPVKTEADRLKAIGELIACALPFTVTIKDGVARSLNQNALQRMWVNELAEQGDMTAEEYRGYCKLHFGIPILRAENDEFCETYDRLIRPLDYEVKVQYMMAPLDFPVTRLMTTKQTTKYLDAIYDFWTAKGMKLTVPNRG